MPHPVQLLGIGLPQLLMTFALASAVPYPYRQRMPVVHEDCDRYEVLLYGPGPGPSDPGMKRMHSSHPDHLRAEDRSYRYPENDRHRTSYRQHPNDYERPPPADLNYNVYNYPASTYYNPGCCGSDWSKPDTERPRDRIEVRDGYNYYNFRRNYLPESRPSDPPALRPYAPLPPTSGPEPKTPAYDPFNLNKNYRPQQPSPAYPGSQTVTPLGSRHTPNEITVSSRVTIPGTATVVTTASVHDKDRETTSTTMTIRDPEVSTTVFMTTTTTMEPPVENSVTAPATLIPEILRGKLANFMPVTGFHSVQNPSPVPVNPVQSKWPDFSRRCESYFDCDFRPPGGNYSSTSAESSATTWFLCDGKFCICELFGGARDDLAKWRVKWSKKSSQCIADTDGPCGHTDGLTIFCEPGYQCINNSCSKPGQKKPKPPSKDEGENVNNTSNCEGKLSIFSLLFFPHTIVNAIVNHSMNAATGTANRSQPLMLH